MNYSVVFSLKPIYYLFLNYMFFALGFTALSTIHIEPVSHQTWVIALVAAENESEFLVIAVYHTTCKFKKNLKLQENIV